MARDKVGTGYVPIKPDTDGFGNELEKGLDKEGTPAASRSGDKMARAAAGAFAAGVALMGKAVIDFSGFEKQMNEVFTLLPGLSADAMGKMTEDVKGFATEFGVLPQEVVPALYQSLSAGVPADNVFAFLETAQKLAKGGVTDLTTAVDGLSSVVNAYGADILPATNASDLMFTTVKLGKTTIDELSASLFQVTPTAAGLGIEFGNVTAALAAMTLQGVPTSVATTQLRQLFVELSKEGSAAAGTFKELSGKSFRDFVAAGGNVQEALQVMERGAANTGLSISDMFGSVEAGSAALALTGGGTEAFTNALTGMDDSAGATEAAFDQMNQGLGATLDQLKAKFSVALLNIGEEIAPTIKVFGEAIGMLLELLSKVPGPLQAVILLVVTLGAGLFAFAKPIMNGIALFKQLGQAMTMLSANPWMLAALALAAIAIVIYKNWDTVKAGLVTGITAIGNVFSMVMDIFTSSITVAFDTVTSIISGAANTATGALSGVVGFVTGIPSSIAGAFGTLADIISAPFRAAFAGIKIAWNSTVGGFGFKTPDWIPILGGKSFTIPSMAAGGVLTGPQMFLGGEYAGAASNPEIVTPQNIMRDTMVDAIRTTGPAGGGSPISITIERMEVRDDMDIELVARELLHRAEREQRAQGRPQLAAA